jgi:hypothetical protein
MILPITPIIVPLLPSHSGRVLPKVVPLVDAIVATKGIQIEASFFLDGVAIDEPAEGGAVVSAARYCTAGTAYPPFPGL